MDEQSKRPPPWQTCSIRSVYQNPWIELSHREVIAPTGAKAIYGLVHFRKIALGIVALDHEMHTWLVGQHRYTLDAWSWEIPEGGSDPGESALAAAQRELREETGLTARHWRELLTIHTSNSVTDEVGYGFVATGLGQQAIEAHDDTEALVVKRLPFAEALEMALSGEISDSVTLACLFKVQLLLHRGELDINGER